MHPAPLSTFRAPANLPSADPAAIPVYADRSATGRRRSRRRSGWVEAPRPARPVGGLARLARPLVTASTMLAVVAMAVVTSVPANAVLLDPTATASVSSVDATGALPVQRLAPTAAAASDVVRDNYTVLNPVQKAVAPEFSGVQSFVQGTATKVRWPFDGGVRISDGFGPRVAPCAGCSTFHLGTDFLPGEGNPVYAMADGVVKDVNTAGGLGVHVVIDHMIDGQLVTTTSAHLQSGSVQVGIGQAVHAGDRVGLVGNTGDSTGPHLHFQVFLNGTDPVDPNAWLQAHAG